MANPFKSISAATSGIKAILFPNVCVCCGCEITSKERQICSFCLNDRFEEANPTLRLSSSNALLPEGVLAQHALWRFDKETALQDLLHLLKYERLAGIGTQLGNQLGQSLRKHPVIAGLIDRNETVLVPVPLHFLKFMRRGFNQAFLIAAG
ncbi:MAG: hypothetical protein R3224_03250, partial [Balneolaceae bacterium]|nr:hypothetical protein [Balneolaceae bacterium]